MNETNENVGILYSDNEIKEMLLEEYPKLKETINKNFDEIKENMKQNEYFMDKIKDTIFDVFLEIIIGNGEEKK